jgi:hypothetical protein
VLHDAITFMSRVTLIIHHPPQKEHRWRRYNGFAQIFFLSALIRRIRVIRVLIKFAN